jgi:hypothetical protein
MTEEEAIQKEILSMAEQTLHLTRLLIRQCDRWLPEEEGRRNVEKRFREREKEKRIAKMKGIWKKIRGVFFLIKNYK